jgi:hypothetical protein
MNFHISPGKISIDQGSPGTYVVNIELVHSEMIISAGLIAQKDISAALIILASIGPDESILGNVS